MNQATTTQSTTLIRPRQRNGAFNGPAVALSCLTWRQRWWARHIERAIATKRRCPDGRRHTFVKDPPVVTAYGVGTPFGDPATCSRLGCGVKTYLDEPSR